MSQLAQRASQIAAKGSGGTGRDGQRREWKGREGKGRLVSKLAGGRRGVAGLEAGPRRRYGDVELLMRGYAGSGSFPASDAAIIYAIG